MDRSVIIVLFGLTIAVGGQIFRLWFAKHTASQLATLPRVALWTKCLSMLFVLLSGDLFLLLPKMSAVLETVLIVCTVIWGVSSITYHLVGGRVTMPRDGVFTSTWSPFQTPEVGEICAHLTPTEHARLVDDARERGRLIGQWVALPLVIIVLVVWQSWRLGLLLVIAFAGYFVLWILPQFRAMQRRSKEMLCETEWGRSQNYKATHLRLMRFPWSK